MLKQLDFKISYTLSGHLLLEGQKMLEFLGSSFLVFIAKREASLLPTNKFVAP